MEYSKHLGGVRDARRADAVKVSAQLFIENGIENVRMTDIAKRAEIGVASLYRYFSTKQSLAIEAACYLWNEELKLFEGVFDSEYYTAKSGSEQINELMKVFRVMLEGHTDFLRFVADFDRYVINEKISSVDLQQYEQSVMNVYMLFDSAYKKGIEDGTLRSDVDIRLFYNTVTHSLMSLSQKLCGGAILQNDFINNGVNEINTLIASFMSYAERR